jgi:DNA-binding transcriptional ArsR family regulator
LELHNSLSEIKKRRELVAVLHARSYTESEIAKDLKKMGYSVDQSTVSRDLKAIKEEITQQFIFDLARFDLAYYYKSCLDIIDQVKREAWRIYNSIDEKDSSIPIRDKLAPLSLIKECSVDRYKLLSEGPAIMAVRALEERLDNIERNLQQEENR